MMKAIRTFINIIIWGMVALYLIPLLLLNVPQVQTAVARQASALLGQTLGTRVTVGRVDAGLLYRIIIDDLQVYDQQGEKMVGAGRASAKFDIIPLLQGRISISSAQLFGLDVRLSRPTADAPTNFQFILDSLSSGSDDSSSPLDLRINTFIMRRGSIAYNQQDAPATPGRLNMAHMTLTDINAQVILKCLRDDSLNVNVKKLSMKEQAGLVLQDLSLRLEANSREASLPELHLQTAKSELWVKDSRVGYEHVDSLLKGNITQVRLNIDSSYVTPAELSLLVPELKTLRERVKCRCKITGNGETMSLERLLLDAYDRQFCVDISGDVSNWQENPRLDVQFKEVTLEGAAMRDIAAALPQFPKEVSRLESARVRGHVAGTPDDAHFEGTVETGAGDIALTTRLQGRKKLQGTVKTNDFSLEKMLDDKTLGKISADISTMLTLGSSTPESIELTGTVSGLDFKSYHYSDISIDGAYQHHTVEGKLNINDPNCTLALSGMLKLKEQDNIVRIDAQLDRFCPNALNLGNGYENAVFTAQVSSNLAGKNWMGFTGTLDLSNVSMRAPDKEFHLSDMHISSTKQQGNREITIKSDLLNGSMTGDFETESLARSVMERLRSRLPSLPGLPVPRSENGKNRCSFEVELSKTDILETLLGLKLQLNSPMLFYGMIDDNEDVMEVTGVMKDFTYAGERYADGTLHIKAPDDTISLSVMVDKEMDNRQKYRLSLLANAAHDHLNTHVGWTNEQSDRFNGSMNAETTFSSGDDNRTVVNTSIRPSAITVNDTVWSVLPSVIRYTNKLLEVENFTIKHEDQHFTVDGKASDREEDTLKVNLKDINVEYIMNVINFHSVEFAGMATGTATVSQAFKTPAAHASLQVKHFKFENGNMGTLNAQVKWNNDDGQIDIHAIADDAPTGITLIEGYVSPTREYIDLDIRPSNARLEFMQSFLGAIFDRSEGHGSGQVRLYGPLSKINLTGKIAAHADFHVELLNATYQLRGDTVTFVPNEIQLNNLMAYDKYNRKATVNGRIYHNYLSNMSYDINISADNLLCYDHPTLTDMSFCGTVFGTGNVNINGRSGQVTITADVTPQRGTTFTYDATSTAVTEQKFITFRDKDTISIGTHAERQTKKYAATPSRFSSNVYFNLLVHATPDAQVRILMDKRTNDFITLYGDGAITAQYFNKGGFDMFGTYTVEHGDYNMTIQNIIKKNFTLTPGGTVTFTGDPYQAALSLQASYMVNNVSLSDLAIGTSFGQNTIRVNCLMNISGSPGQPRVDFDIDLPNVNNDEKQMIRSVINDGEDMNQQVVYLLGIGRFYTRDANNQQAQQGRDPTTLAMNSFLSGTISSQINSILSNVIKDNNWDFSANISTGDEGWYDAEYEGLLSGRLLNNRLLLNGQFGYRNSPTTTSNSGFIGDFDIRYLLTPNGNISILGYNKTNDRYFTKSSLNTQGIGLNVKKDFSSLRDFFGIKKRSKNNQNL